MPINFLSHTADIKMQITAKNLPGLFSEAMKGMFGIQKPARPASQSEAGEVGDQISENKIIKVKSTDLTALLIDFLSEILAQSDINDEIYTEVNFKKLTETELEAELVNQPIKSKELEIKAVTYHQSQVKKVNGGYEAVVVFDI